VTSGRKILVVEDEAIASLLLRRYLESLGFGGILVESTGEGAVRRAEEEEPDLVLMDIRLAGQVDGIEAARRIVARRPTSILFMSGYSDSATLERAGKLKPIGFMNKPLNLDALRESVLSLFPDKQ
jgi:CheY-like chemotaxis protein